QTHTHTHFTFMSSCSLGSLLELGSTMVRTSFSSGADSRQQGVTTHVCVCVCVGVSVVSTCLCVCVCVCVCSLRVCVCVCVCVCVLHLCGVLRQSSVSPAGRSITRI